MENELVGLCRGCDFVLLGGDLNARLGTLGNATESRSTKDPVINEEGERWIEMAYACQLHLLNGTTEGDWEGNYTRIGYENQESSVLDYIFTSTSLKSLATRLEVGTQTQSDHFPLELTISGESNNGLRKQRKVQIWSQKAKASFQRTLESGGCPSGWKRTHQRLLTATQRKTKRLGNETKSKWWNTE